MATRLIVERRFERALGEQELQANIARLAPCLAAHGVRWIHSHLSAARTRMICEYEASDAESVRLANREAGIGFEEVWVASLHEPDKVSS